MDGVSGNLQDAFLLELQTKECIFFINAKLSIFAIYFSFINDANGSRKLVMNTEHQD